MSVQQIIIASTGVTVPPTYATWDSAKKSASTTLSNWDLTATSTLTAGVLSTIGKTTGKWYWEITIVDATNRSFVGVANASANLAGAIGNDATGRSYVDTGNTRYNNVDTAYGNTWTAGDVIGVAWDAGAATIAWYKNGVLQSGGTISTSVTGEQFAAYSNNLVGSCTANFWATAFAYSVPSGFNSGLYS